MTWAEKLGQLQIVFRPRLEDAAALVRQGIGSIFWPQSAAASNALQREAVENTRLGIPLLIGLDVIHGQRTIAPVPLAQAASFDPELVEDLARLAAAEARSGGVTWTFSPMVDVSRDPRWGRVVEGFGEDVHLNAVSGSVHTDLGAPPRRLDEAALEEEQLHSPFQPSHTVELGQGVGQERVQLLHRRRDDLAEQRVVVEQGGQVPDGRIAARAARATASSATGRP